MARTGETVKVGRRQAEGTEVLPTLALRDTVHFPGQINTLHVVREPSVRAIRKALEADGRVLVFSQRDMAIEEPAPSDLHEIGVLSEILQSIPMPDGGLRVALRGISRVKCHSLRIEKGAFAAAYAEITEQVAAGPEVDALERACVDSFTNVVSMNRDIPPEALQGLAGLEDPGHLADTILHHLPFEDETEAGAARGA
jgi:ATP-dependent Lon protease